MICEVLRFCLLGNFVFFLVGILKSRSEFTFDGGVHREYRLVVCMLRNVLVVLIRALDVCE